MVQVCSQRLPESPVAALADGLVDTLTHEFFHALYFANEHYPYYVPRYNDSEAGSEGRMFVDTPMVRAAAREHFQCPDAMGVPLEDDGPVGSPGACLSILRKASHSRANCL